VVIDRGPRTWSLITILLGPRELKLGRSNTRADPDEGPVEGSRARHTRAERVYPNRLNSAELPSGFKGV